MKIFVWEDVEEVSLRCHQGGGVVVVAPDEQTARKIANSCSGCKLKEYESPDIFELRDLDYSNRVYIFPNAGCC